jgi:hypothetical protein
VSADPRSMAMAESPSGAATDRAQSAPPPADAGTERSPTPAPPPPAGTVERPTLRAWLRDHDDKWPFVVLYLAASIVLSIMISLFWLLVVIAVHFAFECVRQAHYRGGRRNVLLHALWEVKLDIGLAGLAFAVALYVDVVLGALGLQSAARVASATRIGARAAAWERNVRTMLLTADEVTRVGHAAYVIGTRRRRGADSDAIAVGPAPAAALPAWRQRWGWGDRIGVALVGSAAGLIVLAPLLTPHDVAAAAALILEQLRPFPS